jgi:hypothetical protein
LEKNGFILIAILAFKNIKNDDVFSSILQFKNAGINVRMFSDENTEDSKVTGIFFFIKIN